MEKRLRSSLHNSAEEFILSATKLGFKSVKPSLKTIIHSLKPSSDLASSLPLALHQSISQAIIRFKESATINAPKSPPSPPTKRARRSSRHAKKDDSGTKDHENNRDNVKKRVVENLQIYAYMALMCVSHPNKAFSPLDILPLVHELHDNLILFESDQVLLSEIANLCEEWWKEQLPGRETLISQSLPFLLSRSLTLKKKVDVNRVYALREAFTLFDFEDESIEDLKLLLIRCLIAPLYLKTEDGRKFVAFMFGLSGQLVKEALAMIRSQIPFGRKSMLEAYADIIFRAWKVVHGDLRDEIENGFLQGLIDSAIHASSGTFAASIRRVLGGFINQRTTDGVERLLFRLAEPVIFRSLQVANSNVRQNALHLLLDLFPLEDPDATKEVKDTLLHKQFFLLDKLLVDECPDVRVIAVEGGCRILHLFWEIIPSSIITKVITKIFDDMTHDASNEVRLSTVNGIMYLLGNPQSHEILKVLLPRIGHLMSDSSLSIRAAVGDLLLLLSDIRDFQFHKVVQLDVLLSTLANDQALVARKITKLLIPSYFPSKVSPEEACNRCVTLLKRSPIAGARFCEFALSEGASLQSLMKLFKVFISLALSSDKLDAAQVDGLLVAAAYLCNDLASDANYESALKEELSGEKLKRLFAAAATGRAQSSVCNIVSTVSPGDVDSLLEECIELITNCAGLSDNVERQAEVRTAHKMMLSCDWFDYMFETLARRLQKIADRCHSKFGTETPSHDISSTKGRKTKSSIKNASKRKHKKPSNSATSRFEDDYVIAVGIAWQIKDLLISEDTRKAILESGVLEIASIALKVISEVSIVECMRWGYMSTSPVLAYSALTLHLSFRNVRSHGENHNGTKKKDCAEFARSSSQRTVLDQTMDHLLNCSNKLFAAGDSQIDASSSPGDGGSTLTKQKSISNVIKMLTAVLKFVVDATAMDLVSSHNQERCMKFTLEYTQFMSSNLRQHYHDQLQFMEDDLKEIFLCLKSSFTYAAKLLNLLLKSSSEPSPPPPEAYNLANNLLDLIISVEEYVGSAYAARIVSAAKQWLPDLVLALGSKHMLKQTPGEMTCDFASDYGKQGFPSWPSILARIELCESSDIASDDDDDDDEKFSSFKKLSVMMVQLLRANQRVLDAVGVIFLTGLVVGLERKDFKLVLGLVHFVCEKLVRDEEREWGELNLMLECLQEIYPQIEREAEGLDNIDDDRKQKLRSAIAMLQPVWMRYIYETGREPMEEE